MSASKAKHIAVALTVAGSDSGGGAGVQADLRTFSSFGVFGASAITAITSQSPFEVSRVDAVPPAAVRSQIQAVLKPLGVSAVKTGMLYGASTVKAVAEELAASGLPLVVDPVMVSTSGAALVKPDAVAAMRSRLLPLAAWITPNIPEAELLAGFKIKCEADMVRAAILFQGLWDCACVVKGGHLSGGSKAAVDIVCAEGSLFRLSSPRVPVSGRAGHGTGCTFSAALTAGLANGEPWRKAIVSAKAFVLSSLSNPVRLSGELLAMFPSKPSKSLLAGVSLEKIE